MEERISESPRFKICFNARFNEKVKARSDMSLYTFLLLVYGPPALVLDGGERDWQIERKYRSEDLGGEQI